MQPRVFLVWCVACLLWSSTFLFVRLGVAAIPPLTFAWTRLVLALSMLLPLAWARGWLRGLTSRDVAVVAGTGLLILGVNYALLYWGAQFIPSGLVAILQSATPIVALLLGWLLGSEYITRRKLVAFIASLIGVAVIFADEAAIPRGTALLASSAVFLGSCSLALGYVCLKTYGRDLNSAAVVTIQIVSAAFPLLCTALIVEGNPIAMQWSSVAIAAMLYLSIVGSVIAFRLNYWLLQRVDASLMLLMGVAEVPIAVVLGVIVLDEQVHGRTLIGAACVGFGVALVAIRR